MTDKKKPAKRGRPALPPELRAKKRCVRLNDEQYEKLLSRGMSWLRDELDSIDAEKVPEGDE